MSSKNTENSKICERPKNFVLVGNPSDGSIQISGVSGQDSTENFEIITTSPGGIVNALVFDEIEEYLYWSDSNMNRIFRKKIFVPGSDIETFLDDRIGSVEGLAIDDKTRVLYFTNIHLGFKSSIMETFIDFFPWFTSIGAGVKVGNEALPCSNTAAAKLEAAVVFLFERNHC